MVGAHASATVDADMGHVITKSCPSCGLPTVADPWLGTDSVVTRKEGLGDQPFASLGQVRVRHRLAYLVLRLRQWGHGHGGIGGWEESLRPAVHQCQSHFARAGAAALLLASLTPPPPPQASPAASAVAAPARGHPAEISKPQRPTVARRLLPLGQI